MQILTPNFATTIATHAAESRQGGSDKGEGMVAAWQIAEKIEREHCETNFCSTPAGCEQS